MDLPDKLHKKWTWDYMGQLEDELYSRDIEWLRRMFWDDYVFINTETSRW